jgi:DNA-binding transcriptional regulator YiaG
LGPLLNVSNDQRIMNRAEIKQARLDAGLTQRATAELLGVSIKTVQSWEGGWRNMPEPAQKLFELLMYLESR